MRHRVAGRKLGRTSAHRLALLRNLSTALFDRERITTTLIKAKQLRPFAERLVTLAKRETLHARRQVLRHIHDGKVVAKLFDTLSARYAQRPGGYTRILKLGPRRGDHAEMAVIELVGTEVDTTAEPSAQAKGEGRKKRKKAAAKTAGATRKATKKKAAAKTAGAKRKATKKKATGKAAGSAGAKRKRTKKAAGGSKAGSGPDEG